RQHLKVLFLCETNGLHSLMAKALLSTIDSEHFEAVSACRSRGKLHPFTIEVMKEIGIDLSEESPKQLEDVKQDKFDYVIAFDDSTSAYPNSCRAEIIHWKFEDPAAASSEPERQLRAFRTVRDQISLRLRLFVIVHVRPQTRTTAA